MGQIFLKRSFNYLGDNRKIKILTQNKIRINMPGCTVSQFFITSEIFSTSVHNLLLYLFISPLKITKQIRSNDFILFLFSWLSLLKNDDYNVTFSKYSINKSVLSKVTTQLIIFAQYRSVYIFI